MHQHVLLYIKQGLEAYQKAFSPVIIIEDQYLQTFVHTLDDTCTISEILPYTLLLSRLNPISDKSIYITIYMSRQYKLLYYLILLLAEFLFLH